MAGALRRNRFEVIAAEAGIQDREFVEACCNVTLHRISLTPTLSQGEREKTGQGEGGHSVKNSRTAL